MFTLVPSQTVLPSHFNWVCLLSYPAKFYYTCNSSAQLNHRLIAILPTSLFARQRKLYTLFMGRIHFHHATAYSYVCWSIGETDTADPMFRTVSSRTLSSLPSCFALVSSCLCGCAFAPSHTPSRANGRGHTPMHLISGELPQLVVGQEHYNGI